jgi:NADH-quinone oxidoreductase subunit A
MQAYIPVLLMGATAIVIAIVVSQAPSLLGPKRPGKTKLAAYECGMEPVEGVRHRMPVQFYTVAVLFMLFDVELVFLYPWAAWFRSETVRAVRLYGLAAMGVFFAALVVGYLYELWRGGLDWEGDTQ